MDNNSYRSQYIQSQIEKDSLSPASASVLNSFWGRVAKAERAIGRPIEDGYSKEDYISLFEKLNITSPTVLLSVKSRIGKYAKWLNSAEFLDQAYVDNLYAVNYALIRPDRIYDLKYFKDFQSLQDAIDSTLWAAEKVDDNVFATQISAIYMAWCGLRLKDALLIKKSDVYDDYIVAGGREIRPNSTIMEYIKGYRDATEFISQSAGIRTRKYVPSQWLFRSTLSDHIDSPKAARIQIRSFGKSGGEDVNIFNYDKIYWSGVFNRAYLYEIVNGEIHFGDVDTMEKLFNEKYSLVSVANKRLKEYQRFKQYFFPSPNDRSTT